MRNLILAITSFFATVLILSGVALADITVPLDPSHTTSATGPDPLRPSSEEGGPNVRSSGVANPGNDCPEGTCFKNTVGGRYVPATKCIEGNKGSCNDSKSPASSSPSSGSKSNGATQ